MPNLPSGCTDADTDCYDRIVSPPRVEFLDALLEDDGIVVADEDVNLSDADRHYLDVIARRVDAWLPRSE